LINEVLASDSRKSHFEFIEIAEICGKKAKKRRAKADVEGYMLLAAKFETDKDVFLFYPGSDSKLVFSKMIGRNKVWREVAVQVQSATEETELEKFRVFTVGSEASDVFDDTFADATHVNSRDANHRGSIPEQSDSPTAIMLVYLKRDERNQANTKLLTLDKNTQDVDAEYVPKQLTGSMKDFIAKHLVDIFVYGTSYTAAQQQDLKEIYPQLPDDLGEFMFSSESYCATPIGIHRSFSRCGSSNAKSKPSTFQLSEESPGMPNKCTGWPFLLCLFSKNHISKTIKVRNLIFQNLES
jgi:hypothetical protein